MASVYACTFRHPLENLLGRVARQRSHEARFTARFASIYQKQFAKVHAGTTRERTLFVREVPVPGNGIPDLVVLSWKRGRSSSKLPVFNSGHSDPTLRAFEIKISKWRIGLMQAHRYRYFSNAAVLVVPREKLANIEPYLDLFQALRVGLWGFDERSGTITPLYTPRPKHQHVTLHRTRAIDTALQAASP